MEGGHDIELEQAPSVFLETLGFGLQCLSSVDTRGMAWTLFDMVLHKRVQLAEIDTSGLRIFWTLLQLPEELLLMVGSKQVVSQVRD